MIDGRRASFASERTYVSTKPSVSLAVTLPASASPFVAARIFTDGIERKRVDHRLDRSPPPPCGMTAQAGSDRRSQTPPNPSVAPTPASAGARDEVTSVRFRPIAVIGQAQRSARGRRRPYFSAGSTTVNRVRPLAEAATTDPPCAMATLQGFQRFAGFFVSSATKLLSRRMTVCEPGRPRSPPVRGILVACGDECRMAVIAEADAHRRRATTGPRVQSTPSVGPSSKQLDTFR
jgi:hypothetical protein